MFTTKYHSSLVVVGGDAISRCLEGHVLALFSIFSVDILSSSQFLITPTPSPPHTHYFYANLNKLLDPYFQKLGVPTPRSPTPRSPWLCQWLRWQHSTERMCGIQNSFSKLLKEYVANMNAWMKRPQQKQLRFIRSDLTRVLYEAHLIYVFHCNEVTDITTYIIKSNQISLFVNQHK